MQFHRVLSCSGNYTYFNYINRVADSLGLDPETDPDLSGRTLAEEQRAIKVVKGCLPRQSAIVPSSALFIFC